MRAAAAALRPRSFAPKPLHSSSMYILNTGRAAQPLPSKHARSRRSHATHPGRNAALPVTAGAPAAFKAEFDRARSQFPPTSQILKERRENAGRMAKDAQFVSADRKAQRGSLELIAADHGPPALGALPSGYLTRVLADIGAIESGMAAARVLGSVVSHRESVLASAAAPGQTAAGRGDGAGVQGNGALAPAESDAFISRDEVLSGVPAWLNGEVCGPAGAEALSELTASVNTVLRFLAYDVNKESALVAEALLRSMPNPDLVSFGSAMDAHGRIGDEESCDRAFGLFRYAVDRFRPEQLMVTTMVLLTACGRARQWRRAVALLSLMTPPGTLGPDMDFSDELPSWLVRGLLPAADVVAFDLAARACASVGQTAISHKIFESMRAVGIEPSIHSFNAAIAACRGNNDWKSAAALLQQSIDAGLALTQRTTNLVMSICLHSQQHDEVLRIFVGLGNGLLPEPGSIAISMAITAASKAGYRDMVHELIATLEGKGVRLTTDVGNVIIDALRRCNEWELAASMFKRMQHENLTLNRRSYNMMLATYREAGEFDKALDLFRSLEKTVPHMIDRVTLNTGITVCAQTKNWEEALRLYEIFAQTKMLPDESTCRVMCRLLQRIEDERANAKLSEIRRYARERNFFLGPQTLSIEK